MLDSFYRECAGAFAVEFGAAWRKAAHADPLLSQIPRVTYDHGMTNTIVDVSGVARSSPMQSMTAAFELKHDVIERGDVLAFQRVLDGGIAQLRKQVSEMFFRKVGEAAESVGNVLDNAGKPLTGRFLCDMIERMEIDFDEFGVARMPTIVCSPDKETRIRELLAEPDVQLRLDVILREKWLAKYSLK